MVVVERVAVAGVGEPSMFCCISLESQVKQGASKQRTQVEVQPQCPIMSFSLGQCDELYSSSTPFRRSQVLIPRSARNVSPVVSDVGMVVANEPK